MLVMGDHTRTKQILMNLMSNAIKYNQSEGRFLVVVLMVGFVFDTALLLGGILDAPNGVWAQPLWLTAIWLVFATTLKHSLSWLRQTPILLVAILGGMAGTASYIGGANLSASGIQIHHDYRLLMLSFSWAIVLPFLVYLGRESGEGSSLVRAIFD
jgi:hypothetical protein